MRTKDVVEQTGVDRETLRFYERKSLLPDTKRTSSGYRIYPDEIIPRINFITTAKSAGFTLREIKELIELKQSGATCRVGRDLALEKKKEIKEKIKALRRMDKILGQFVLLCEEQGGEGLRKKCHLSFDLLCKTSS